MCYVSQIIIRHSHCAFGRLEEESHNLLATPANLETAGTAAAMLKMVACSVTKTFTRARNPNNP